jgi:hypothetical protein
MTYREQIERLIEVVDLAYELAGSLRDTAVGNEKEPFNTTRHILSDAVTHLHWLDDQLSDKRTSMPLGDKFDEYIKKRLDL